MKKFFILSITSVFLLCAFFVVPITKVFASNGTIDPTNAGYMYAKFNNDSSQLNFNCINCNVVVSDSSITGNAWSENYGWINLSPSNGGVLNNGGVLSGYAWGENAGWVNFSPLNSGVSIDTSTGNFYGHAWSENYGWIDFDCSDSDSCVNTDWRPSNSSNGGGGGIINIFTSYAECEDGVDNDGDGFIDYPDDLGCSSANSPTEKLTACSDLNASNPYSSIEQVNINNPDQCVYVPVTGCTDLSAVNFNSLAVTDNGSCLYAGCMDPSATNYDKDADFDNASCSYPPPPVEVLPTVVSGCTNPVATNYDSLATLNNGTCILPGVPVFGCIDARATNYNSQATTDNNSCVFPLPVSSSININKNIFGVIKNTNTNKNTNNKNIPLKTAETLAVIGLALPAIPIAISIFSNLLTTILRFINLIPVLLGLRRRKQPWGTVYDSVTKQPLDPAYVSLTKFGGRKEIAISITDLDGRYGFLVEPGSYRIKTKKGDYVFPSQKLAGKKKDSLYEDIYFGEEIKLEKNSIIQKNIPMDPVKFNWNEFEKSKNKKLMKFFSKGELFLARISAVTFALGIIFSFLSATANQSTLNILILLVYILVLVLRLFGVSPKKPGYVIEENTGYPLSLGLVKIFSADLKREVAHTIINKTGGYYTLVSNGDYYMTVSKKTGEDSYEDVYTSEIFKVKNGHINRKIRI
jgi:hypothetical protein